ncbi:3-oxoacyl-ACP synthase III family protein [Amycolatopsis sp. NPDC004747]
MGIGILGTGSYLPSRIVTNEELVTWVPGATADWIETKTLIKARRHAAENQAASDLAVRAAERALETSGISAGQLDFVIVSTSTGDHPQPPTACRVQQALGAYGAAAFDINVVCAGFVHATALAQSLIATRPGAHVLVIAAEVYSRFLDYRDRRISVLLGDGAGAAVIGEVPDGGIIDVDMATDGGSADLIIVEAGGSRRPTTAETAADLGHTIKMNGRAVRDFVLEQVPPAIAKLLARAGVRPDEIDHFVPHQPNGRLLAELVEACGLQGARTHTTLADYGNTGSASVPVTLDAGVQSGAIAGGDLVLLSGFGGGMSTGTCLLRWTEAA